MTAPPIDATGYAALAICESMLLAMTETKVMSEAEATAVLQDAAAAHRNALPSAGNPNFHERAAAIIELILSRGNSVRFE